MRSAEMVLDELGFLRSPAGDDPLLRESKRLIGHELYRSVHTLEEARRYMEYQVWCVWDFMTLGKSVQVGLGSYSIPWTPPLRADLLVAINGILEDEEYDRGPRGIRASHFELFLGAMHQAGAKTQSIERFVKALRRGQGFEAAIGQPDVPRPAREFVKTTLRIARGPVHSRVACFCITREELVPRMFDSFVQSIAKHPDKRLSQFIWYLKRHVQLDTSKHGPLSRLLVSETIGGDAKRLAQARKAVLLALRARLTYLDATLEYVRSGRQKRL